MAITFQEFEEDTGFDECADPPWLMVPLEGTNQVRLMGGKDAQVIVPPNNKVRLEYEHNVGPDKHLEFRGLNIGSYIIKTFLLDGTILELELGVKKRKSKAISFYFVKVKGKKEWSTQRNSDDVQKIIKGLNDIFEWQANTTFAPAEVVFELQPFDARKAAAEVSFAGSPDYLPGNDWGKSPECETTPSFGKYVAGEPKFTEDPAWNPDVIIKSVPSVGDFRVFFVRSLTNVNSPLSDTDGISSRDGSNIMCEDALGPNRTGVTRDKVLYKVIAHEIAHTLRKDPGHMHYQNNRMLLFRDTTGGLKLSKDDINKINESL